MRSTPSLLAVSPLLRRLFAVSALSVGLAGLTGLAACGNGVDSSETVTPLAAAPAPAPAAQAVKATGPGGFFLNAAEAVGLRPDQQQTVADLRTSLAAQTAPVREARAKLGAELAQQVRAGVIDHARTQPLLDAVAAAVTATGPALAQAAQRVHDTLDATQRQALVAKMREKGAGHAGHRAVMRAHLDRIAAELSLTDDQRSAIHTQMKAAFTARAEAMAQTHGQWKARMETLATAFAGDTFDARALGVGDHGGDMAKHFAAMHGAFLDAAVPLLTPAQRTILATKIEERTQAAEPADDLEE